MTTPESHTLTVSGVRVSVVRKAIKNLHLGVYPPDGRVRVAAPLAVSDAAVRVAVAGKLPWIRRQRATFAGQARESDREMVSGESHFFQGRRYRLAVVESDEAERISLRRNQVIELCVRPGADLKTRTRLLESWYRDRLRDLVLPLVEKWEARLGVTVREWGIKKMKTRWGSCSARVGRIWLNAELIKKPPACLEYVVVHELAHLIVRNHDEKFLALMDRNLPNWRARRMELNEAPLGTASWSC